MTRDDEVAPLTAEEERLLRRDLAADPDTYAFTTTEFGRVFATLDAARAVRPDAALREALLRLVEATDRYLDDGRNPESWASDRSRMYVAMTDGRAVLAVVPLRSPEALEGLRDWIRYRRSTVTLFDIEDRIDLLLADPNTETPDRAVIRGAGS